ncbi:chromate transporter [Mycoplasma sp. Pen4]|uniref:chromate transporter n=1 Tax=Mycoplasma sp. Pen4 TaxID=640330 RepID=UPI001CA3B539|nr:chromate transporter [Mycoplasma sp. Pen4]
MKTKVKQTSSQSKFKLFWEVFFFIIKVTFLGFGGGNALLPVIKNQAVDKKKWLTQDEFDDVVIVTNMLPGASVIQTVSYICIKLLGKLWGTILTLVAILPHVLVAFGILVLFSNLDPRWLKIISVGVLVSIIAFLINFASRYLKQAKNTMKLPFWITILFFTIAYSLFVPAPYNLPVVAIFTVILVYTIIYLVVRNKRKNQIKEIQEIKQISEAEIEVLENANLIKQSEIEKVKNKIYRHNLCSIHNKYCSVIEEDGE